MKINVSFPATGCQKLFEVDDEKKLRSFYEKRMGHEVEADHLGDEWKGYILRIAGGNDKQGFPMKQGVLTNNRVRLLLSKGQSCYRPRRTGERKRKSVRGCIVDSNLSVLALVVVKKGLGEIPGLTDKIVPRKLGPKRASKVRKLFCLEKKDDVRRYVIKRPLTGKEGKKPKSQAPKIQRLITPSVLLHRRHKNAVKRLRREKNKELKGDYAKLLATRQKETREKKREEIRRRRSSMRESKSSAASAPTEVKRVKVLSKKPVGAVAVKGGKKPVKVAKVAKAAKAGAPVKSSATKTTTPKTGVKQLTKEKSKSIKVASSKASLQKAPVKATKHAPAKTAPTKSAGAKTAAPKAAPAKTVAPKAAPAKTVAPKAAPAKTAAPKPAPAKTAAPKAAPAKPKPAATPKAASAPKPAAAPKAAASKPAASAAKKPAAPKPKPAGGAKAKPQKK